MAEPSISPALTPEEWAEWQAHPDSALRLSCAASEASLDVDTHGLAALCLYQQPFGFTHEDVALLRIEVGVLGADRCIGEEERAEVERLDAQLKNLTARIAALLPPG